MAVEMRIPAMKATDDTLTEIQNNLACHGVDDGDVVTRETASTKNWEKIFAWNSNFQASKEFKRQVSNLIIYQSNQ